MKVAIEVGKPTVVPADNSGPAYHVYPVTVNADGAGKRVTGTTLSVNGSGVATAPVGRLNYNLTTREHEPGNLALFASATDGSETAVANTTHTTSHPTGQPTKTTTTPPPAPPATQR